MGKLIALKVGGVTASDRSFYRGTPYDRAGPSVLIDAVALLPADAGVEDLLTDATARDFLAEAFQHRKFIGYNHVALPLLEKAGIAKHIDEGVLKLSGGVATLTNFVEELGKLRLWGREPSVKLGSASATNA
ncbi:hypothetical protein GCM10010924_38260 [Rhizobium wenxiniae]|uniref:Catalase n=1 Tax=Rhizobium wenxiniae TaxID=1737357 RepID=A0A7W9YA19_9HYPH|nr:hypothetical protein [Rhizobium wenxiniae]GGG05955.1 hypothetical protein GCM10010924_38260 [Rhizobium wenxiniae]